MKLRALSYILLSRNDLTSERSRSICSRTLFCAEAPREISKQKRAGRCLIILWIECPIWRDDSLPYPPLRVGLCAKLRGCGKSSDDAIPVGPAHANRLQ